MENSFTIYNLSKFLFQLRTCFFFDRAPHFGLAFVVEFLAFCDTDLELYPAIFPVNAGHDERHSFLRGLFYELFDLAFVEHQLSRPQNVVVIDISVRIVRNVRAKEPNLAVLDLNERFFQLNAPGHYALDLRPQKHGPGLVFIKNVILEIRLPIVNDLLLLRHKTLSVAKTRGRLGDRFDRLEMDS